MIYLSDHSRKRHILQRHSEIHVKTEPTDTEVETMEEILLPSTSTTPLTSQATKKFKCDSCEKLFKTKMYLNIHMYNTHDRVFSEISEKNIVEEPLVENRFLKKFRENNTPNLEIDQEDMEEKFEEAEFEKVKYEPEENSEIIENEFDNNSEIPELNCEKCDKTFSDHGSYYNHYRKVHNEEKSFKCSLCEKKFTTKRSVFSHIQNVHSGLREHKCDLCGILFSKFTNLNSHYDAVHEKLKNHKCIQCGKSFSQKSNLKTHVDYVHR